MRIQYRALFFLAMISVIMIGPQIPAQAAENESPAPSSGDIGSQIRFPVEKYKLANGLTVLLVEDHTAPLVSYHTWFRVGSKYEEPGFTGIAHLFEHMMFKGAKRYQGGQLETILQANGATNNAFTTHDYTGYYENLPSAKLELVMDIESDRMENLQITPENLASEKDVVKEERRYRVDNNPNGVLNEALFSTVFRVHPYRWPVIGYMDDISNITLEKAQEFYKTYYAPNNAVIVIAGDINPSDSKKLIEKYYGRLKPAVFPTKVLPEKPAQTATRSQFLNKDVQNTTFAIAYHTPKAGTDDSYALDLLANVMGRSPSSRLYKRLVYKDQTASGAATYNETLQDSGLFEALVSLKPGASFDKSQRAVYGEIWRPRNLLVGSDELESAKMQTMKSYVDSLKTIYGKASALALNEILFSDYEQLFRDLERYAKVTPEQIKVVAQKYLDPSQSSLVVLQPMKAAQAAVVPRGKNVDKKKKKGSRS